MAIWHAYDYITYRNGMEYVYEIICVYDYRLVFVYSVNSKIKV